MVEWYLIAGVLLVGIALAGSMVDSLPLTLAVVYLGVGMVQAHGESGCSNSDRSPIRRYWNA